MIADAHGADVKIVGCSWLMVPHGVFVHDDITAMDQLKGKTMAISSPGAFPDLFARGALDHFNIPEDSVKFASLGGDLDRYKALVAKLVDAAVMSGEYTPIAEKEHIKMLVSAKDALPHFIRMCDADDRRDAQGAARRRREILGRRNARFALRRRPTKTKSSRRHSEMTGTKPDDPRPAFIYDLAMAQHSIGTDMPIPTEDLAWMNEELVKVGNIPKPVDLTKVLDPQAARGCAEADRADALTAAAPPAKTARMNDLHWAPCCKQAWVKSA